MAVRSPGQSQRLSQKGLSGCVGCGCTLHDCFTPDSVWRSPGTLPGELDDQITLTRKKPARLFTSNGFSSYLFDQSCVTLKLLCMETRKVITG